MINGFANLDGETFRKNTAANTANKTVAEIINSILSTLLSLLPWVEVSLAGDHWLGFVVTALVHCVLLIHVPAVGALFFIWLERKVSGRIQDRLGPTRVGGAFGWLQGLADGIKLIGKEDLMPGTADPLLFKVAPYIAFAASFAGLLALPFASGWVGQHLNHAVFFILAIVGLEVFGVILAGYASGSKWSLFGGMREAAQVVSYEVPVGMCALIPVMIAGTMNLTTIADMQSGLGTNWFIVHDPFTLVTFFIFFTCAMASVNRAPFDLAEAESELVAGFHTEYSGIRWSIFFMAEYGSMFIVSALATLLFLGGWHGPIPIAEPIANAAAGMLGILPFVSDAWVTWIAGYLANLMGCVNFIFKSSLLVTLMIWVRWTLPRLRIDQVITMCWKYCVPISAVCFVGLLGWQFLGLPPFLNAIAPNDRYAVREHWAAPVISATKSETDEGETQATDQSNELMTPVTISPAPATERVSQTDSDNANTRGGA